MSRNECLFALTSLRHFLKVERYVTQFVSENDPEKWLTTYFSTGCKFTCFAACKALVCLLTSEALSHVHFQQWMSKLVTMLGCATSSLSTDCQSTALVFGLDCMRQVLVFFQKNVSKAFSLQSDILIHLIWEQRLMIWPESWSDPTPHQTKVDVLLQQLSTLKELTVFVQAVQAETACAADHTEAVEIASQRITSVNGFVQWLPSTLFQVSKLLSSSQHIFYHPVLDLLQVVMLSRHELMMQFKVSSVGRLLLTCMFEHTLKAASSVLRNAPRSGGSSTCVFIQSDDVVGLDVQRMLVTVIIQCFVSILEPGPAFAMETLCGLLLIPEVQTCCSAVMSSLQLSGRRKPCCELFHLTAEDDDCLLTCLLSLLSVHDKLSSASFQSLLNILPFDGFMTCLDPHHLFQHLLSFIASDHLVLVDWLMSNETCFLRYFLAYLHAFINSFELLRQNGHGRIAEALCKSTGCLAASDEILTGDEYFQDLAACQDSIKRPSLVDYSDSSSSDDEEGDRLKLIAMEMDIGHTGCEGSGIHMAGCTIETLEHPPLMTEIAFAGKRRRLEKACLSDVRTDGVDEARAWKSTVKEETDSIECPCLLLEDVMTVLIRLRLLVDRLHTQQLFPYPPGPLLRLLCKAEELYEGNSE